jgi:hypothetical protein
LQTRINEISSCINDQYFKISPNFDEKQEQQ